MTASKESIMNSVLVALNKKGFNNKFILSGILSVIGEEANFKIESENLNYSSERMIQVFPSHFSSVNDTLQFVGNPEALADFVYGGIIGNNLPGDGWKYRGRGLNQLTGKANYDHTGKRIGKDLVSNPDLVNNPDVAAAVVADYFYDHFQNSGGKLLAVYGAKDMNDFKDVITATKAALNANAGWGNNDIQALPGYNSAVSLAPAMLTFVENNNFTRNKILVYSGIGILLIASIFFLLKLSVVAKIFLSVATAVILFLIYKHT